MPADIKPTTISSNRIVELESVRGMAAFMVVIFHFQGWNSLFQHIPVVRNSFLMVDIFFVLSGFVIYTAYGKRILSLRELAIFQFLRFGRLYPVHLLFLALFLTVEFGKILTVHFLHLSTFAFQPFEVNSPIAFLQQLFMVQAIGPTGNSSTFNGPAWSISVEFYTYLLFGVTVLLFRKWHWILFVALLTFTITCLAFNLLGGFEQVLQCLTGFFIGCLTAIIGSQLEGEYSPHLPLLGFAVLVLVVCFDSNSNMQIAVYFAAAMFILTLTKTRMGLFRHLLQLPLLRWLGTVSYSLYMTHGIILYLIYQTLVLVLKKQRDVESGIVHLSLFESISVDVVAIVLILVASVFVYRFVEKPFRQRSRDFVFSREEEPRSSPSSFERIKR